MRFFTLKNGVDKIITWLMSTLAGTGAGGWQNCRIHHTAFIAGGVFMRVGKRFRAGRDLWLEAVNGYQGQTFSPRLSIGDDVACSWNVHIAAINEVVIGNGVLIGSNVLITDHNHGNYARGEFDGEKMPKDRLLHSKGGVSIGRNVLIGDGVAILAGTTIGDDSVIGANSVVTGTIPAGSIAVGNPAKVIRKLS